MSIVSTWLTLNRACNLSCKWCYAQKTIKRDNMKLDTAKRLIDISIGMGTKNFKLIGGEPTIYPYFFEIIKYLINYNVNIIIVTNGIKLADKEFCYALKKNNYPHLHLGISIKGSCDEEYLRDCGINGYSLLLSGIRNCDKIGLDYSLSYTLTYDNIATLESFASNIRTSDIKKPIFMSYCNNVISDNNNTNNELMLKMDYAFSKKYEKVNAILENKLKLHQIFPLCMCEPDTYAKMIERGQITTTCHVNNRKGLIFDIDGSILLCNHLAGYGIGHLDIDFSDLISFKKYWNSKYVLELYNKFTTIPSVDCLNCEYISRCGGGCFLQWFSQHFDEYKKYQQLQQKKGDGESYEY